MEKLFPKTLPIVAENSETTSFTFKIRSLGVCLRDKFRICLINSAAFAPLSGGGGGGAANGEEGVMEALRTSLREMEAELGPDDPNVQELRKMLKDYQRSGS